MTQYLLTPRDPLVLRDGRGGDTVMKTLPFPWPSSTTGCLRTLTGMDPKGRFALTVPEALQIEVHGPLLAEEDGSLLVPTPADCLWNRPEDDRRAERWVLRRRLAPAASVGAGAQHDSGAGQLEGRALLAPIGGAMPKEKAARAPAFWPWAELRAWLADPQAADRQREVQRERFREPLPIERRTHVKIDAGTGTAEEGMLFSTEGLRLHDGQRAYSLALRCDDPRLREKVGAGCTVHLGGERRLSYLARTTKGWPAFDPATIPAEARRLRVVLLTPGLFDAGWRPAQHTLGGARLVGAAVGRPQTLSGWSVVERPSTKGRGPTRTKQWGPKPVRRMVAAGAVFWVELPDGADARTWAEERWFGGVADQAQDRRDGFGLCVVGRV